MPKRIISMTNFEECPSSWVFQTFHCTKTGPFHMAWVGRNLYTFNGKRSRFQNFLLGKLKIKWQCQELSHGYYNTFVGYILTWMNPLDLKVDYSDAVCTKMLMSAKYISGNVESVNNHLNCVLVQSILGI